MSGTFIIGERKVRPGVYYRRENGGGVVLAGAVNGIGAALFQADWGPLNKVFDMDLTMANNIKDYYGNGEKTAVLKELFNGGSKTIRAVRIGNDDGVEPSVMLKNADGVDALQLVAKYPGEREFTVTVRTNLITDNRELIVYDGEAIFEKVSFESGGDEVASAIEAMERSKNFVLKKQGTASGVLANVTQVAMTGGRNPSVTVSSYEKGTDILERYKWNCVVADTDDTDVHLLLDSFCDMSYETGHLGMACIAGKHDQDLDERMMYAASFNDEKIVYVLNGWNGSDGTEYEGWRAAARIGGMVSAFPTNTSLTHDVISNAVSLNEPLTNGEIIKAEQKGCLVLSLNDSDQVWVDSAINTLVTCNEDQDEGWKKIRRTKCRFELMDRVDSTCEKLVGKVNNDTDGQQTVIATAQRVVNEMIAEKKLGFGSTVYLDPGYTPEGDSSWFKLAVIDIDSMEKIYLTYLFKYNQEQYEAFV